MFVEYECSQVGINKLSLQVCSGRKLGEAFLYKVLQQIKTLHYIELACIYTDSIVLNQSFWKMRSLNANSGATFNLSKSYHIDMDANSIDGVIYRIVTVMSTVSDQNRVETQ